MAKATTKKSKKRSAKKPLKEFAGLIPFSGSREFGFSIDTKAEDRKKANEIRSFVPPHQDDGAVVLESGGVYGTYIDVEGAVRSEYELICRYREMAMNANVDMAIKHVVNQAIVVSENEPTVSLILDRLHLSEKVKDKIRAEFDNVLRMLDFHNQAYELFRQWYVDGRLYYSILINENPKEGIQELRNIDPRQIRKVREIQKKRDQESGIEIVELVDEYFAYNEMASYVGYGQNPHQAYIGAKVSKDAVAFCHSGLIDPYSRMILGHLNTAIVAYNQLKMMEASLVIYRITRSIERRVFYVDTGDLPPQKANQYLREVMVRFRNKPIYDASTGEIKDDRNTMSATDDIWIPRRNGSNATQIETLEGGQNLGKMEDVEYFLKNLYKSLGIPYSRFNSDSTNVFGKAAEISRDELEFTKQIDRLQKRFAMLFVFLLKTQCILKGICDEEEWEDELEDDIRFKFLQDSYYQEMAEAEIWSGRIERLDRAINYVGKNKYFSKAWINRVILRLSEEEVEQMNKEIEEEAKLEEDKYGETGGVADDDKEDSMPQFTATFKPSKAKKD